MNALSERMNAKPERMNAKPERMNAKAERVNAKPERMNAKSERINGKSERVDGLPDRVWPATHSEEGSKGRQRRDFLRVFDIEGRVTRFPHPLIATLPVERLLPHAFCGGEGGEAG